jgi:NAD(P)-dependent dehydrogenase (short-subunit alcohol dehydrogenase family)
MIERNQGSIITMTSAAARKPGGAPIAYAAAKAGIIVFSQQVAHEVGPAGVRVNCLSPSTVLNEHMEQAIPAETQRKMAAMYRLRRLGVPTQRRPSGTVPRLRRVIVDHRHHPRHRRRPGHDLNASPGVPTGRDVPAGEEEANVVGSPSTATASSGS